MKNLTRQRHHAIPTISLFSCAFYIRVGFEEPYTSLAGGRYLTMAQTPRAKRIVNKDTGPTNGPRRDRSRCDQSSRSTISQVHQGERSIRPFYAAASEPYSSIANSSIHASPRKGKTRELPTLGNN